MYTALCYVPRGAAKLPVPSAAPPRREELVKDVIALQTAASQKKNADANSDSEDEVDLEEILADDLNNLTAFSSNKEDPYLKDTPQPDAMFDEDERDDLEIRSSDALILACRSDDDISMLEVHVVEEIVDDGDESDKGGVKNKEYAPNVYVHHDLILPAPPLCAQYVRMRQEVEGGNDIACNFVAVGMYGYSGIDIWDVDRMDTLVPAQTLGGPFLEHLNGEPNEEDGLANGTKDGTGKKKKKANRKSRALALREGSHVGPVMCLAWHPTQQHYLASGSSDHSVKIWDTRTGYCMATLEHHSDKVQSIKWHPEEEAILLTGSFDKTIAIVNVQSNQVLGKQEVDADIESVHWLSNDSLLTALENGKLIVFKYASEKLSQVIDIKAHKAEVSACACSPSLPGMVVTGSTDKQVKVWDFRNIKLPELVHEMKSDAGAVFSIAMEPWTFKTTGGSPFLCTWAGAKGKLVLRDLAVLSSKVRTSWPDFLTGHLEKLRISRARGSFVAEDRVALKENGSIAESSEDSDTSHEDM